MRNACVLRDNNGGESRPLEVGERGRKQGNGDKDADRRWDHPVAHQFCPDIIVPDDVDAHVVI